jgi:hypothetical protein
MRRAMKRLISALFGDSEPDYCYTLQPIKRLAQCPFCARLVELVEGGQVIGACPHFRQAERVGSKEYARFVER